MNFTIPLKPTVNQMIAERLLHFGIKLFETKPRRIWEPKREHYLWLYTIRKQHLAERGAFPEGLPELLSSLENLEFENIKVMIFETQSFLIQVMLEIGTDTPIGYFAMEAGEDRKVKLPKSE